MPEDVESAWGECIAGLLVLRSAADVQATVSLSSGAQSMLQELAVEFADRAKPGNDLADYSAFAARVAENATRMALVLHGIRHGARACSYPVPKEDAACAVQLARWFFARTQALLARHREDRGRHQLGQLLATLETNGGCMPLWKLRDRHSYLENDLRTLAGKYPDAVIIEKLPSGPKGGRMSEVVRIVGASAPTIGSA